MDVIHVGQTAGGQLEQVNGCQVMENAATGGGKLGRVMKL